MIAFTDVRNDDTGKFEMVPFEYDEQAELSAEIQTRLSELSPNLADDELYSELDQIICDYKDDTDIWCELESFASKYGNDKFKAAYSELLADLLAIGKRLKENPCRV